jgi:organic radical activating enzyme
MKGVKMEDKRTVTLIENMVSWQGEGIDVGRRMIILRFKYCNLKCPWCDTSVKMRISSEAPYTLESIQENINENSAGLMITGGEPTIQRHINDTLLLLNELVYPVANIETNGYNLTTLIEKTSKDKPIKIIYSPKIFSRNDCNLTIEKLKKIEAENIYLKFVYEPDNRYQEVVFSYITINMKHLIDSQKVYLMPEGTTRSELLKNSEEVFNACEKYNFNFSSRDHIIYSFI